MEHQHHELPPLPASLQRRLGAVLAWAAENAQEVADRALEPLGLNVKHFGVMTFLRHETEPDPERGSLSQQAIGERLRIDRTTMVALIDDLERGRLREARAKPRRPARVRDQPHGGRKESACPGREGRRRTRPPVLRTYLRARAAGAPPAARTPHRATRAKPHWSCVPGLTFPQSSSGAASAGWTPRGFDSESMLAHLTVLFPTADLDAQDVGAWRPWPRTHLG